MSYSQSRNRRSLGDHAFCVACPLPIGPTQRLRDIDGLPVHLACYRRLVRDSVEREIMIAAVRRNLEVAFGLRD